MAALRCEQRAIASDAMYCRVAWHLVKLGNLLWEDGSELQQFNGDNLCSNGTHWGNILYMKIDDCSWQRSLKGVALCMIHHYDSFRRHGFPSSTNFMRLYMDLPTKCAEHPLKSHLSC